MVLKCHWFSWAGFYRCQWNRHRSNTFLKQRGEPWQVRWLSQRESYGNSGLNGELIKFPGAVTHINCYMQGLRVFRCIYETNKWKKLMWCVLGLAQLGTWYLSAGMKRLDISRVGNHDKSHCLRRLGRRSLFTRFTWWKKPEDILKQVSGDKEGSSSWPSEEFCRGTWPFSSSPGITRFSAALFSLHREKKVKSKE